MRRPMFWAPRTLIWRPWGFYGPTFWPYRYSRWRYVHGYNTYVEHSGDSGRSQLPPDGPNFVFLTLNSQGTPSVFNQLQYQEVSNLLARIRNARDNAPQADCCTPSILCCCLCPIFGCLYWCADRAQKTEELRKQSIHQCCHQISAGRYSPHLISARQGALSGQIYFSASGPHAIFMILVSS